MDSTAWYDDEFRNEDARDDTDSRRERQQPIPRQQARPALRLIFQFDGTSVNLATMQPLRKLIPPMVGEPPEEGRHSGDWLQLRDSNNRVLFTRLLNDPLQTRAEVHDPDSGPSIVVGPPGEGTFDVVVPDLPEAVSGVLFASTPGPEEKLGPAEPIARFDLPRRDDDSQS